MLGQLLFSLQLVERIDGAVHGAQQVGCRAHQRRVEVDSFLDCFNSQSNFAVCSCVQQLVQDSQIIDTLVFAKGCTAHVDHTVAGVKVFDIQPNRALPLTGVLCFL